IVTCLWGAGVIASVFLTADRSFAETARVVDEAMRRELGPGETPYVFGTLAHQLALGGTARPLYYYPSPGVLQVNREFAAFRPRPHFYIRDVSRDLEAPSVGTIDRALPGVV